VPYDDGARSWDSGRRADAVAALPDASLVVPRLERRGGGGGRGPDAVVAPFVVRHAIDATPARRRGGVVSHRSIQPARFTRLTG